MKHNPLISVIVPIYNVEIYLHKCLESILSQTFSNLEIILVDDGSPDNCGIICDEYAKKDARIIVIHKKNGGLSSARNKGLDIASGDYVMFVDGDDFVEQNFCEKAISLVNKYHVDICSFGYNEVFENRKEERKTIKPRVINTEEAIFHIIAKDEVIYNFAWNKIYSKQLFDGVRYPIGRLFEDSAVTYLLFHKAQEIYVANDVLYNYVQRQGSIMSDYNSCRCNIDRFEIWMKRFNFIQENYPSLISVSIVQLANQALNGLFYLKLSNNVSNKETYINFLYNYKDIILQTNKSLKFILYFKCRLLFWVYMFVKECRRKIKGLQTI